jgi:hypothetical protein
MTFKVNLNLFYNIIKLFFNIYIPIYSFYKLFTSDYGRHDTINNAYINPVIFFFSIDLLKNIYEKRLLICLHHAVGLTIMCYRPMHLYVFYNKCIVLCLSALISSIFSNLMHLNFKTKIIKISFLITFSYRFFILYQIKMLLLTEKNTFITYDYVNLHKIISIVHLLFFILHIYWMKLIIKSTITNKQNK